MLEVNDLHAYYGKSHILQGVSFDVQEGEIVSLLGRNGVGRSTTVKAIMGEVPPQGSIKLKGKEIAEDEGHRAEEDIQKLTDKRVAEVDKSLASKEADLKEV